MRQTKVRRTLDRLTSVNQLGSNAINCDVDGPAPRVELSSADCRSQRRIALSDEFHCALHLFAFGYLVCLTNDHHTAPMCAVSYFLNLQTDCRVCFDEPRLHS